MLILIMNVFRMQPVDREKIKTDLLIFDFDGTLVTSGEDLVISVNHTRGKLGLPALPAEAIISFVGDGVHKLIERAIGPGAMDRFDEAMQIFTGHYTGQMLKHTRLFPGVIEVLEYFGAKRKLIVTNKRYRFTRAIAEALGIDRYFEEIIGSDNTAYSKPDPRLLEDIMTRYGVKGENTVVVGDGINDIKMAKQAGALVCAFLNGLGSRDELLSLSPDLTCENLLELKNLLA
jgi:phosphoglycolate phosphatase